MILRRISILNYKNVASADLELSPKMNCFIGRNGEGKTNVLDSIYFLSLCKSSTTSMDAACIRHGEDFCVLQGSYEREDGGREEIYMGMKRGVKKQMKRNKKAYRRLAEHIGLVPLVMVSPTDGLLIAGGSEERRRFMDVVLSQTDHRYLEHLIAYTKALEQRNRLLKQMWDDRLWDDAMVAIWDTQLATNGEYLTEKRVEFVRDFTPLFSEYYHWIVGTDEPGTIDYRHDSRPMLLQLEECRQADKYSQYTNAGPHKDDLIFLLSDENTDFTLKKFGSQGQQKSFALALKLAQFQYILNHSGEKPILLLDDIFDKLDLLRIKRLIALVGSDRFGQVLLSDTQPGRVQAIFDELPTLDHKIFQVDRGSVTLNS
jgi:DNA replication and repair protein RecF